MVDRDLSLGFRALSEGIIGPDQLRKAMAECLHRGDCTLSEVLEAREWASPEQLADLRDREAQPSTDDAGATCVYLGESTGPIPEPTTRPWLGSSGWAGSSTRMTAGGRYERVRVHGLGGLGRVWLARDLHLGREVALKELRDDRSVDPGLVQRFVEEARITGRLEHPGIVTVHDMVEEDGEGGPPFYTMRFLPGRTLAEAVDRHHRRRLEGTAGPLEFRGLLDAFTAVCQAVAFAHSRDVLHRDLKGTNVVLGDFGEVSVIDWGLAKSAKPGRGRELESSTVGLQASTPEETEPGSVLGTPGYLAPELLEGGIAGRRTDVYSLGALLYLILTGRSAYAGGSRLEVLRALREREPEPPRSLVEDAPRALEAICQKAMAREPSKRYDSAVELAEEVRRWLADEPVEAYPDPPSGKLARWARKRRATVLAASTALVSAVIALSIATTLIWQEQWRTAAQKVEAVLGRNQAQANLQIIQRFGVDLVRVADGELASVPGAERARVMLFDRCLSTLRTSLRSGRDDTFLKNSTAWTGRFSANLHQLMNDPLASLATYHESATLFESLVSEFPAELNYRGELALVLSDHAQALARLGRLREAMGLAGRSVEVARLVVARFPDRPQALRSLAASLNGLAALEGRLGHAAESARWVDEAVGIYEVLLSPPSGKPSLADRYMMASSLTIRATARRELGRGLEARADAERGAGLMRSILEEDPTAWGNASDLLARSLLERARTVGLDQGFESARADLDEAILIWDRLANGFRLFPMYKERAAEGRRVRGALCLASGAFGPAEDDLEAARQDVEALALKYPEFPSYRAGLGLTYLEQGRLAERLGPADRARSRLEQAVRSLEGASDPTPEDERTRSWLAEARAELARLGNPSSP